jgi:hypothetical protein
MRERAKRAVVQWVGRVCTNNRMIPMVLHLSMTNAYHRSYDVTANGRSVPVNSAIGAFVVASNNRNGRS